MDADAFYVIQRIFASKKNAGLSVSGKMDRSLALFTRIYHQNCIDTTLQILLLFHDLSCTESVAINCSYTGKVRKPGELKQLSTEWKYCWIIGEHPEYTQNWGVCFDCLWKRPPHTATDRMWGWDLSCFLKLSFFIPPRTFSVSPCVPLRFRWLSAGVCPHPHLYDSSHLTTALHNGDFSPHLVFNCVRMHPLVWTQHPRTPSLSEMGEKASGQGVILSAC